MTESISKHTVKDLLDRAIQIELQTRSLYLELARRFAHHQESLALWEALAAEEDVHAQVLVDILESALPEKLMNQAPADVWANMTRIETLMRQTTVDSIKNLKDAFDLAHQLEYSEVNAVFEFLSVDVVPGHLEREFVRTHITLHQKRLADFGRDYVGENWVEVIPQ